MHVLLFKYLSLSNRDVNCLKSRPLNEITLTYTNDATTRISPQTLLLISFQTNFLFKTNLPPSLWVV